MFSWGSREKKDEDKEKGGQPRDDPPAQGKSEEIAQIKDSPYDTGRRSRVWRKVGSFTSQAPLTEIRPKAKALTGPDKGQIYVRPDREIWETRFDFLVSMLAFVMDYSTIWRFPYLCFKNGGSVFLIPYVIMMVFCAFPILYLELIIGQFVREGAIGMWKICPLFKGVGYAVVLMSYIVTCTYNIFLAWTMLYTFASCSSDLPWAGCDNEWNTDQCIEIKPTMEQSQRDGVLAGEEYFREEVLQMENSKLNKTYSLTHLGKPITMNVIYLTVVYMILIIFLIKGVTRTVRLLWICTAVPLVILALFAFRCISVPGSRKGLIFFFAVKQNIGKLAKLQIWCDAALQAFYSTGLGFGVHVALASFNEFRHKIFRDIITVLVVNGIVSLMSLTIVFGFVGASAFVLKKEMEDMQLVGHRIIFDIFPDALARLPGYNFYSFVFFLMLFSLAFAGNLVVLQCVVTSIKNVLRSVTDVYKTKSCIIIAVAVTISYIVGCLSLVQGGFEIFSVLSDNVATTSLLFCAFLQVIGVSWFFGLDHVCRAEFAMNERVPHMFVMICWKFITPVILLVVTIKSLIPEDNEIVYEGSEKYKKYLRYAIIMIPICLILMVAFTRTICTKGPMKCLCVISPVIDHDVIRQTLTGARAKKKHWTFIGTQKQLEEAIPELKIKRQDEELAKQMKKHPRQPSEIMEMPNPDQFSVPGSNDQMKTST